MPENEIGTGIGITPFAKAYTNETASNIADDIRELVNTHMSAQIACEGDTVDEVYVTIRRRCL